MKKLALITTAAIAAAFAGAPAAQAAPEQYLKVKLTKNKASKKNPTTVGITIDTGTTPPATTGPKATVVKAQIDLPKGILLNYKAFPTCSTPGQCEETAPDSQVGEGIAKANVDGFDYEAQGTLKAFVGTGAQLFIYTQFQKPAVINETLVGKVTTKSGAYSFGFDVQPALQQPIDGAYQQLNQFLLGFPAKTVTKQGKKIGLVQLKTCPKGGYVFKGSFTFRDGSVASPSVTVPCKQAK